MFFAIEVEVERRARPSSFRRLNFDRYKEQKILLFGYSIIYVNNVNQMHVVVAEGDVGDATSQ